MNFGRAQEIRMVGRWWRKDRDIRWIEFRGVAELSSGHQGGEGRMTGYLQQGEGEEVDGEPRDEFGGGGDRQCKR